MASTACWPCGNDGTVFGWGRDGSGQLGDPAGPDAHTPRQITALTGATALVTNWLGGYALMSGGTVLAWGSNQLGSLGNGTFVGPGLPTAVPGISGAIAIAGADYEGFAILGS